MVESIKFNDDRSVYTTRSGRMVRCPFGLCTIEHCKTECPYNCRVLKQKKQNYVKIKFLKKHDFDIREICK